MLYEGCIAYVSDTTCLFHEALSFVNDVVQDCKRVQVIMSQIKDL